MNKRGLLAEFTIMIIGLVLVLSSTGIGYTQNITCDYNGSASISGQSGSYNNSFSNTSSSYCYTVASRYLNEFSLMVSRGSVALWISQPGETNYTNYGTYPIGSFNDPALEVSLDTRVALIPSGSASFGFSFSATA
jgi:hypothetical protein